MSFLDDLIDERTATKWIQQGTEEWDQIRVGRFTASQQWRLMDAAKREMTVEELKARPKSGKGSSAKLTYDHTVLSDAAMTYINEKVAEVLTGQCKQQGYAFPIVWGTEKEPEARERFREKTGFEVETVGFFTYTDHAGGSPDGLVNDDAILEIKCPFDSSVQLQYLMLTDQWDLKRCFKEHYWQCQSNMLFTERELCHFVTYDPRMQNEKHQLTHMVIRASKEDQDLIIAKIAKAVEEKLKLIDLLK